MKFDFESLSTEPLFYMLMNSGAFVTVLGFIFFSIGLLFGYASWGRYKRLTRELRGEAESMKAELADLKRKVGDHAVKSGPAIAMATETIYMPKKEVATVPPVTEEKPDTPSNLPLEPSAKAEEKAVELLPAEAPTTGSWMFPAEPLPSSPAHHFSPLTDIIATHPDSDEHTAADEPSATPAGLVLDDLLPDLTELSLTPLPAVEIQPVVDPKLGLIYLTQPRETDDLTAVKGIAPVLEKRLQEFGIYTFAQIAAWDEDQIKEFSTRLAFKDRIQRENWVEQASQMAVTQTLAEVA